MLSDREVDDLERAIAYSTLDQLPFVLSKAIPLLFSELRTVRAALDQKTNDFLETFNERLLSGGDTPRPQVGDDNLGDTAEIPLGSEDADQKVSAKKSRRKAARKRSRRGRDRTAARSDQGELEPGDGGEAMGGQILDPGREPRILPIEDPKGSRG